MEDKIAIQILEVLQKIDKRLENIEENNTYFSYSNFIIDNTPDPLLPEAVKVVMQQNKASASLFQRHLQIGYARAARVLDQMEKAGVVGPGIGANPRKVYLDKCNEYLSSQKSNTTKDETK